jgi:SAM-dependent methyltransferase
MTRLAGARLLVGIDSDRFALVHPLETKILRIQARAERLPIKTGAVTIVVAISLLEHLKDQPEFFQELARVLEPGGLAVLQIPELRYPIELHTKWPLLFVWNNSIRTRVLMATGYDDLNMSTSPERTIQLADEAGLNVVRVVPIWHFRLARLVGVPMGYFLLFKRKGHETERERQRGLVGES